MHSKLFLKIAIFVGLLVFLIRPYLAVAQSGAVTLNHLNLYSNNLPDSLPAGVQLQFFMKVAYTGENNSEAEIVDGVFKIYSPEGASWQPPVGQFVNPALWQSYFDLADAVIYFDANGSGVDTIHFFGWALNRGLPSGFSDLAFKITTMIDTNFIGSHICFDSARTSDGIGWAWWQKNSANYVYPSWDGPHCFKIVANCCQGLRGDFNGDGTNSNILDLTYQVDFQFRGGPKPACRLEGDFNSDGYGPNVQDLADLITFIFRGGPPGDGCP